MSFTSVKAIVLIQVLALVLCPSSNLSFGEVTEDWSLDNHQVNEIISIFRRSPGKSTPSTPNPSPAKSPGSPANSPPPLLTLPPTELPPPTESPLPPSPSPLLAKSPPPSRSSPLLAKSSPAPSPLSLILVKSSPPPSSSPPPPPVKSTPPPSTDYDEPPVIEPPVDFAPPIIEQPPFSQEPPYVEPPINQPPTIPFPPTLSPPSIPRIKWPIKLPPPAIHPSGKPLIVVGRVNCKSCNSKGLPSLFKASPLHGASVKLVCRNNGKKETVQSALTNKNGEFTIIPISLTSGDVQNCRVFLGKSPKPVCNVPTNFNNGKSGAILKPVRPPGKHGPGPGPAPVIDFFGVGPFIFEAPKIFPCSN